ncbi:hypothetical protein ACFQYP_20820 [Nonomuraea antimicrobica]
MHAIARLSAEEFGTCVKELADLLVDAVDDGASVGFVTPFGHEAAEAWWRAQAPPWQRATCSCGSAAPTAP